MTCADAKSLLSPYLDGAVTGMQMHALGRHIDACPKCKREYALLMESQRLLGSLGRKKAPADLALKLRLAISHEVAHARRPRFEGVWVRLDNLIQAFMVPATAGLVAAIIIFGVLMGFFGLPNVQAMGNNNDVPLMLYTQPELQSSAFGMSIGAVNSDSLVIEAYVGADGRVQDYRILSDPKESEDLLPQVKNMLIFTTFRPATSLGRPMPGRAVLSFSKISVKG
jgi:Putative zinc-finger